MNFCPRLVASAAIALMLNAACAVAAVQLRFDYSAAEETLAAFDSGDTEGLLRNAGVVATILNARFYEPAANEAAFVAAVSGARTLAAPAEARDPVRMGRVYARRPEIRALLAALRAAEPAMTAAAEARVAQYAPPDPLGTITVHFILGGLSDGFYSVDGKADTFDVPALGNALFLRIDQAKVSDLDGIRLNLVHELFHVVQGIARRDRPALQRVKTSGPPVPRLLATTLDEGTANLVADASRAEGTGDYLAMWQRRFARHAGADALRADFALLDALVAGLRSGAITWENAYLVGFSSVYESPLYFVGYEVGKVLERRGGPQRVAAALREDAGAVLLEYARYCRTAKDACRATFSAATIQWLEHRPHTDARRQRRTGAAPP